MSSPQPPDGPISRNAATWVPRYFGAQPPPAPRGLDLAAVYATALHLQRERPPLPGPGYRLYWMTATHLASRDVLAAGSSQVVVGRHTSCDAVLEGDASIALRHLLIRSTILDDGCPRLSVLDLETDGGFFLPDGRLERSIFAAGPFAIRVGAYAIVALPGGIPLPEQLPVPVCDRADGRPQVQSLAPARQPMSRITLMPRAMMLADRPTLAVMPQAEPPVRDYESRFRPRGPRSRSTYRRRSSSAVCSSGPQGRRRAEDNPIPTWDLFASTSSSFVIDPIVARTISASTQGTSRMGGSCGKRCSKTTGRGSRWGLRPASSSCGAVRRARESGGQGSSTRVPNAAGTWKLGFAVRGGLHAR